MIALNKIAPQHTWCLARGNEGSSTGYHFMIVHFYGGSSRETTVCFLILKGHVNDTGVC